jgi:WD40 repeat protein
MNLHHLQTSMSLVLWMATTSLILADDLPDDAVDRVRSFEADKEAIRKQAALKIKFLEAKIESTREQAAVDINARRDKLLEELRALEDEHRKAGQFDDALAIRDHIRQLQAAAEGLTASPAKRGLAAYLDHDGRRLAVWTGNGTLRFFELQDRDFRGRQFRTREEVLQLELPGAHLFAVGFSPDGESSAVVQGTRGEIYVWDFLAERKAPPIMLRGVGLEDGQLREANRGKYLCFAVSPDGKLLAGGVARLDKSNGKIQLWEATPGRALQECKRLKEAAPQDAGVCWLAFTPDGDRLVSGNDDGEFCLWNLASGEKENSFQGAPLVSDKHLPVALAQDGRTLAQAMPDHSIQLWDVISGQELHCLRGHTAEIRALSFCQADGKRLSSASNDGQMYYWDKASGGKNGVRECTDPETIVTSGNGKITVWNGNDHNISYEDHELGYSTGSDLP